MKIKKEISNQKQTIFDGQSVSEVQPWYAKTAYRVGIHGADYPNFVGAGVVGKPKLDKSSAKKPVKQTLLDAMVDAGLLDEKEYSENESGKRSTKLPAAALEARLKKAGRFMVIA